ncbi:hypothetical protein F5Y15DRAFT_362676 [Xylariaceae sp. FL0016]|nr:hypothetical protein F5Y15DRAFT_362676 [Xylariaceae sp. FL0016]
MHCLMKARADIRTPRIIAHVELVFAASHVSLEGWRPPYIPRTSQALHILLLRSKSTRKAPGNSQSSICIETPRISLHMNIRRNTEERSGSAYERLSMFRYMAFAKQTRRYCSFPMVFMHFSHYFEYFTHYLAIVQRFSRMTGLLGQEPPARNGEGDVEATEDDWKHRTPERWTRRGDQLPTREKPVPLRGPSNQFNTSIRSSPWHRSRMACSEMRSLVFNTASKSYANVDKSNKTGKKK